MPINSYTCYIYTHQDLQRSLCFVIALVQHMKVAQFHYNLFHIVVCRNIHFAYLSDFSLVTFHVKAHLTLEGAE